MTAVYLKEKQLMVTHNLDRDYDSAYIDGEEISGLDRDVVRGMVFRLLCQTRSLSRERVCEHQMILKNYSAEDLRSLFCYLVKHDGRREGDAYYVTMI